MDLEGNWLYWEFKKKKRKGQKEDAEAAQWVPQARHRFYLLPLSWRI